MDDKETEQPASHKDLTVLMEKMTALEQNIAKMQEKAVDERLNKIESSIDELLKAIKAGALEDTGEDVEGTSEDQEEEGESKKKVPKGEKKTSSYTGDGKAVSTKGKAKEGDAEEKSTDTDFEKLQAELKEAKDFNDKLLKRLERVEKGQAVYKGEDSEFGKSAQPGYLRNVLAAAYGMVG